jgi:alkylated DNA repair dioxygenase AlkB
LLFGACGEALVQLTTEEECAEEPSYVRLRALVDGSKELKLDEIFGNYYRPEAKLLNHTDGDNVLFSMTVALGDDCEFVIGEPTHR